MLLISFPSVFDQIPKFRSFNSGSNSPTISSSESEIFSSPIILSDVLFTSNLVELLFSISRSVLFSIPSFCSVCCQISTGSVPKVARGNNIRKKK